MTDPQLLDALRVSQSLGFLGPGDVTFHVEHALAYGELLEPGWRILDLGTGGGVPGLALAVTRPDLRFALLDANSRRCEFVRDVLPRLNVVDRVAVLQGRAEVLGHQAEFRSQFDAVVARSFGPPAVTAECGAPFLGTGGVLLVSEPPDVEQSDRRWPEDGLALIGLQDAGRTEPRGFGIRHLRSTAPCPARYPRRVGVPTKRPLFGP